jgi:hypothetical protein
MKKTLVLAAVALAGVSALLIAPGCASARPNQDPTGRMFPRVEGESLSGVDTVLPDALAGEPTVLLVGYVQATQFDLDRWLVGLLQAGTPAKLVEVPTIEGLVPTVISGWIDSGMRSGIPSEDWGSVVTVYGGAAAPIVELTGNENPRNGRVLLLDREGRVAWFHDRGFSAAKLLELDAKARALAAR